VTLSESPAAEGRTWSADGHYWKQIQRLTGAVAWSVIRFVKPSAHHVPKVPGVYMICTEAAAIRNMKEGCLGTPLYVGKSDNLNVRVRQHLAKPPEVVVHLAHGVPLRLVCWYREVASAFERAELEHFICLAFNCPGNKRRPPTGQAIKVRMGSAGSQPVA